MATRLAAAASAVFPLIMGPPTEGVVLGSLARALIIGLHTPSGPRTVSILGREATGVPNGVRLAGGIPQNDQHRRGDPVLVGDGGFRVGELRVRVVRSWDSRVRPIRLDPAGVSAVEAAAAAAERGVPVASIETLRQALGDEGFGPAVDALVGLGRGLTPGGDDVLAGLLIGLHAAGQSGLARMVGNRAVGHTAVGHTAIGHTAIGHTAVAGIYDRTTVLSADLLRLAADGQACLEALVLLRAIHARSRATNPIHRLLSIGHTSGADLATGLAMGLRRGMSASRQEVR